MSKVSSAFIVGEVAMRKESSMSIVRSAITLSAALAVLALTAVAGGAADRSGTEAPRELKSQTNCPVMGGEIDSTYFTDIQGQRVYHCCPACSEKLTADPDKYFKKAAAEGVLFENVQTTCPVDGMKLKDKSTYTDYEGRRIAFCGVKCRDAFSKDPVTYLESMDKKQSSESGAKTEKMGASCSHDGCGHGM
jgi:YHS domain-containing protein